MNEKKIMIKNFQDEIIFQKISKNKNKIKAYVIPFKN